MSNQPTDKRITGVLLAAAWLACLALVITLAGDARSGDGEMVVIPYDSLRYPHIECLAGRVIAETAPHLSARERNALWREYGLRPSFEWLVAETGFSYHELEVVPPAWHARLIDRLTDREPQPRELKRLVPILNADPRVNWAAPDALVLEWCQPSELPPGEELIVDEQVTDGETLAVTEDEAVAQPVRDSTGEMRGANFIDPYFRPLKGGFSEWQIDDKSVDPVPDFEYYRLCAPEGTAVNWAAELRLSNKFLEQCSVVYGTNQALALAKYRQAGSAPLAGVTVVVADTGVHVNHPDLMGRLHPNSIDANLRNYRIAAPDQRPAVDLEITNREEDLATGLPREAIADRPAAHGTAVAGIVTRCTDGFGSGGNTVRILPASIKTASTMRFAGPKMQVKSPISAFVKLIACLYKEYPTGEFSAGEGRVRNTGDVRVVSTSASMPRTYFSDAEWKLVAPLIGKAAGSIAEDLRENDRVYLFAAGNEALSEPSRPGEMDYIIAVAAAQPFNGGRAWFREISGEGSNLGMKCVSAPGYGVTTSTLQPHPNLAYLPDTEFPPPVPFFAVPAHSGTWDDRSYRFSATSAATPQVAALAALLYAQDSARGYVEVIELIGASTGGRKVVGDWGEARGLVDYNAALRW